MHSDQVIVIRVDYTRRDSIVCEYIKYVIVPAGSGKFYVFFQCTDSQISLILFGHELGKFSLARVDLGQASELIPREVVVKWIPHFYNTYETGQVGNHSFNFECADGYLFRFTPI
jgi:hypothetical protein